MEDFSLDFLILLARFTWAHLSSSSLDMLHFPCSLNKFVLCFQPLWAPGMTGAFVLSSPCFPLWALIETHRFHSFLFGEAWKGL